MRITSTKVANPTKSVRRTLIKGAGIATTVVAGGGLILKDSIEESFVSPLWRKALGPLRSTNSNVEANSAKAWGAVGAATGAAVGSYIATPLALLAVWQKSAPLGGIGQTAVTAGAAAASFVFKPGRLVAGTIGGAMGYVAGGVADSFGHQPASSLGEATKDFRLGALPKRLLINQNSTPTVQEQPAAREALDRAKPGDVILAHKQESQSLAVMTELAGGDGSYSHVGLVGKDGQVFEIRSGPAEARPKSDWGEYEKIAILRPRYRSEDSVDKTDREFRRLAQGAQYSLPFGLANLGSEKEQYCGKIVQQSLQVGAPEIEIAVKSRLGMDMVLAEDFQASPDVDVVYESGTSFWQHHLRNFA